MRQRAMIIVLAIFFGLAAALLVTNYAKKARDKALEQAKTTKVLMATGAVPVGFTLDELKNRKLVEVREVPKGFVASDAIRPKQKLKKQTLTTSLSIGEQITTGKFKVAKEAGLAFIVPENMVAVAIPIDNMKAAGNLVKIGDYVNIVGTAEIGGEPGATAGNQEITKTFLQKVQVLAVGTNLQNPEQRSTASAISSSEKSSQTAGRTATLALTQADAEKLIYMQEEGRIWLTLLPSKKAQTVSTEGQTIETVFQ